MTSERASWRLAVVGCVLALTGCGSDGGDGGNGGGNGAGTVTETWASFCTATFTEDVEIRDVFDDPVFTASAGQEYLLAEYGALGADLVYLTNAGPELFEVEPDENAVFPFTSGCEPDAGVAYYAVFTDVSVYADEDLTMKVCDLRAGTAVESAGGLRGYSSAGGFSLSGPTTYEVYLDAFSAECGDLESGYISVPQTEVFGTTTWLVPIIGIIGPS